MVIFHITSLALAASAVALTPPRDVWNEKRSFFSMPITRRSHPPAPIRKRDSDVPLYNISSLSYLIELGFGTPAQKIKVAIDTGSDELWVNPDCTTAGDIDLTEECFNNGQYDADVSATSQVTQITSSVLYGKGEVNFQYVADNITLPESTLQISQQIFGVAYRSSELNEGILGLSWGLTTENTEYPNFIDSLYLQGHTNTRAFSVALGNKDHDNGGTLIFGGIDTKRFTGDLVKIPILGPQMGERMWRYWINLDNIAFTTDSNTKTYMSNDLPIVLDSGSSLSYLPNDVVTAMGNDLNGRYDQASNLWQVPCAAAETANTMDFTFDSVTIRVPMYEFIWEAIGNVCILGAVGIADDDVAILGDSMMRAGYFVFDQDNQAIHMAQYAYCGENEQAIAKDDSAEGTSGECGKDDTDLIEAPERDLEDSAVGRSRNPGFALAAALTVVFCLT